MQRGDRIYVAGRDTLIGGALHRQLLRQGYRHVIDGEDPDLTHPDRVDAFFASTRPDYVFVAAGKSGGIRANRRYPADFIRDNLLSASHLMHGAARHGVTGLLYLASSCSYPRHCPQPMRVESLMTGPLEPTNEAYATSKLAGLALCRAYRRQYGLNAVGVIPANVFGPGDDFSREDSHVIAALLRRMHEAKAAHLPRIDVWGSGTARREFIFADDLADACLFVMRAGGESGTLNVGSGVDVSIRELAQMLREVTGYTGSIRFDTGQPDGMPVKVLDSSRLHAMGWRAATPFRAALEATYAWFVERYGAAA